MGLFVYLAGYCLHTGQYNPPCQDSNLCNFVQGSKFTSWYIIEDAMGLLWVIVWHLNRACRLQMQHMPTAMSADISYSWCCVEECI